MLITNKIKQNYLKQRDLAPLIKMVFSCLWVVVDVFEVAVDGSNQVVVSRSFF